MKQLWLMGDCALFLHWAHVGDSKTWTEVLGERSCSGEGIWGGSLCGLSADLGMTAGEENEAALRVTQDAGSIGVLTPLPYTRLREKECIVTAEFGSYSSSPLPRSVVTPSPGCLHPGLQCFVRITSHLPGGLVLWELGPYV